MLFSDWLEQLTAKMAELARQVYIAKHRRTPEEFVPTQDGYVLEVKLTDYIDDNLKRLLGENIDEV